MSIPATMPWARWGRVSPATSGSVQNSTYSPGSSGRVMSAARPGASAPVPVPAGGGPAGLDVARRHGEGQHHAVGGVRDPAALGPP
jgi:hypothetical protein